MAHNMRSAESAVQLLARLEGRHSLKDIEPHLFPDNCGPLQGDVLELHGAEGTGKTEALYHLVACCILPAESGGMGVEVMFVDTDCHFDILRLVAVLERRLARAPEEAVHSCLRRLSVLHCASSIQLLLTLHYLEATICSRPSLCLLVVDSISAFYWVDRNNGGESVTKQESNLRKIAEFLEKLLRDYRIVVFATTHAIMRNYESEGTELAKASPSSWKRWSPAHADFSKAYLCRSWQRIVTHRLLFSKADVPKDKKQVFTVLSSCTRTSGTKRSSFCVTDQGVQFV